MATNHIASAGGGEQIIDSPARQGSFVTAREDLTITHARYAAGERVASRHIHHQHTDAFYILEGEVIFQIGPRSRNHHRLRRRIRCRTAGARSLAPRG
jgi:mannose-6-phosphate isomerase-like protein (cupin superfamily)